VENFKNDFFPHLVGQKPIKINMEKYIVYSLATSQSIGSYKKVVKVLRVDRRNVKKPPKQEFYLAHLDLHFRQLNNK
jgi:hypothetical protein